MHGSCRSRERTADLVAMIDTACSRSGYEEVLPMIERTCMSPGMARSVFQGYHLLEPGKLPRRGVSAARL